MVEISPKMTNLPKIVQISDVNPKKKEFAHLEVSF